jgi:hypothetical protein
MGAVRDTKYPGWVKKSLQGYNDFFPGPVLNPEDYFNAGFLVASSALRPLFSAVLDFHRRHREYIDVLEKNRFRKGTDQTPLNYLVKKHKTPVHYLPEEYNLLHFVPFIYDHPLTIGLLRLKTFIQKGYIWHFNGIRKGLNIRIMKRTWETIREHYD